MAKVGAHDIPSYALLFDPITSACRNPWEAVKPQSKGLNAATTKPKTSVRTLLRLLPRLQSPDHHRCSTWLSGVDPSETYVPPSVMDLKLVRLLHSLAADSKTLGPEPGSIHAWQTAPMVRKKGSKPPAAPHMFSARSLSGHVSSFNDPPELRSDRTSFSVLAPAAGAVDSLSSLSTGATSLAPAPLSSTYTSAHQAALQDSKTQRISAEPQRR